MKKITLILLAAVLLAVLASAEETQIGETDLFIDIPENLTADEVTQEDLEEGLTAYYFNDTYTLGIYLYDADGASIADAANYYSSGDEVRQAGITRINGLDAAYYTYSEDFEGENYSCVSYIFKAGSDFAELSFVVRTADIASSNEAINRLVGTVFRSSEAETEANTSQSRRIQIPGTDLYITIPEDYREAELDESELEEGLALYCYAPDEALDMAVYVSPSEGETLDDYLAELEDDTDLEEWGKVTINGFDSVYYVLVSDDTDVDETSVIIGYILTDGGNTVLIVFYLDETGSASAVSAGIMESIGAGS